MNCWASACGYLSAVGDRSDHDREGTMRMKYAVKLTEAERARLRTLVGSGTAPARLLTRARIVLKANHGEGGPGWTDASIAAALEVHPATVARVRRE